MSRETHDFEFDLQLPRFAILQFYSLPKRNVTETKMRTDLSEQRTVPPMSTSLIQCTTCEYSQLVPAAPRGIVYVLEGAGEVRGFLKRAWCLDCEQLTYKEDFDRESIDNAKKNAASELAQANSDLEELRRGFWALLNFYLNKRWYKEQISDIKRTISGIQYLEELASARRSSPKCLSCGSTRVIEFSENFRHSCGGHLRIVSSASNSHMHFAFYDYVCDANGYVLEERLNGEDPTRSSYSMKRYLRKNMYGL